jgi:four helix bundle protein
LNWLLLCPDLNTTGLPGGKAIHRKCKKVLVQKRLDRFVKDQLSRASFSVRHNIAEGSGKFSKPDRRNCFLTARGPVYKFIAVPDALRDVKIICLGKAKKLNATLPLMSRRKAPP